MKNNMIFQTPKQQEDTMMKLGFTEKSITPQGQTMYSKPAAQTTPVGGQVGSSFGKMIGGGFGEGIPSMGGLEAASMRLADAAAKRERETKEFEYGLERKSKSKDIQISQAQSKIEQIKQDIKSLQESPPSINKNAEIEKRRQALQRAENELNSLFRE